MNTSDEWKQVITAEQVTAEVLELVEELHDGFYQDDPRIDWHDFLCRIEVCGHYDLGGSLDSGAIKAIKKHIRNLRR